MEHCDRNDLNQELVEHCAKAAQKDFGTYGMTGMKPDILWQAVAATVIHEAVLFLKAGNPLRQFLDNAAFDALGEIEKRAADGSRQRHGRSSATPHRLCYWDKGISCDCISIGDCPAVKNEPNI